ncbi:GAF domain-containing protein [Streptantibioticus ferralitis]
MNQQPADPVVLTQARDAALAGRQPSGEPRPLIGDSWHRMLRTGVDPERGNHLGFLPLDEIEHRRRTSPLGEVLPTLHESLRSVTETGCHLVVVTDADGRVLWRAGSPAVRRSADRLELVEGAAWAEEVAGTNGIGTALVTRRPVQVHSTEHYVRALHQLTCAAAPLHDPRDGRLLGAVDVTCPAATTHPATLALVSAVARVAEGELRLRHWESVERLRSAAAPVLARLDGQAVAVDRDGWTAAITGLPPMDRVALPDSPMAGETWLPSLGQCVLEPLPGGWLVRVGPAPKRETAAPSRVTLDLTCARSWTVTVSGPSGSWSQRLSPRHAELLFALAVHRCGRSAAQLAADLFGDATREVTVRAELSRLRRNLAGVLAHRPYRFADEVAVGLLRPDDPVDLLPFSSAPVVRAARGAVRPDGGPLA